MHDAQGSPVLSVPRTKRAQQAELAQATEAYLAEGHTITELDSGKISTVYKPAFNRNPEFDDGQH